MITFRQITRSPAAVMPGWLLVTVGLCLVQAARVRGAASAWKVGTSHRALDELPALPGAGQGLAIYGQQRGAVRQPPWGEPLAAAAPEELPTATSGHRPARPDGRQVFSQPASAEFGFDAWLGAAVRPPARHGVEALCAAFRRMGTPRRHLVRDTRGCGLDPW